METQLVQVPAPKRTKAPKAVKTKDAARPYWALYVKALHKWFCAADLNEVVGNFCAERDCGNDGFGWGASEIGGMNTLYIMNTVSNKLEVGTVAYNGNVKLNVVLS